MESISARTPSKQQQQGASTRSLRGGSATTALSAKSSNRINTRTAAALNALKTPDKQRKVQLQQQQAATERATTAVVSGSTRKKRIAVEHHEYNEESAVIKNGRALMAATTTQLGAPAEINSNSNKRRRVETTEQQPVTIDLTTPKKQQQPSNTAASKRRRSTQSQARAENRDRDSTESRRAAQERENKLWKIKYTKAFKGFIFYFDGIEEGTKRQIERALKQLDSAVEPFFSKEVTHVLTTRPIPPQLLVPLTKPNSQSASKSQSQAASIFAQSISTTASLQTASTSNNSARRKSSSVSPVKHALSVSGKQIQQQQQQESLVGPSRTRRSRNAVNAARDSVLAVKTPPKIKAFADVGTAALDSQDVLIKAHSFGMKLWTLEKLHKMVARLLDCPSPPYTHGMSWNFNTAIASNIQNAGSNFALQMATGSHSHSHHSHAQAREALRAEGYALAIHTANTLKASLPSLLRAEALTGSTYERDLSTLRPDYTYFSSKTGYLLVEDSSQEYQPAHTKVFDARISAYNDMVSCIDKDPKSRESTVLAGSIDWPVLHGGQEGRTAFSRPAMGYNSPLPNLDIIYQTSMNANKENLNAGNKKGKMPAMAAGAGGVKVNTLGVSAPSLRRSASMNALNAKNGSALTATTGGGVTTRLRSKQQASINLDSSFQAASGNSQIISSNLASATSTTTTRSGQVIGGSQAMLNGGKNSLANGIIVDKRLARLGSKAGKHIVTLGSATSNNAGSSTSSSNLANKPSTLSNVHNNAGAPSMMKRSLSLDAGLNRLKPIRPPREEVKKPGYCENCRVRYDDFKAHTKSKKHRRFALDQSNWTELDDLIAEHIQRPILPELLKLYQNAETEVPSDIEASDDSDSEMEGEEEEEDSNSDDDEDRHAGYEVVDEAQLMECGFEEPLSIFQSPAFLRHLKAELGEDYKGPVSENTLHCLSIHVGHAIKPAHTCFKVCHVAMKYAAEVVGVVGTMHRLDRKYAMEKIGLLDAMNQEDSEEDDDEGIETDSEEEDAMQGDSDEENEDDEDDEDEI